MKYCASALFCLVILSVCYAYVLAHGCLHRGSHFIVADRCELESVRCTGAYLIIFQCVGRQPRFRPCINGRFKTTKFSAFVILLLLLRSGDVELNPGPRGRRPKFPCALCERACRWGQRAIACDTCDGWYHIECLCMGSAVYGYLGLSNVSWTCCQCGMPNFSSSLFDSTTTVSSNRFASLDSEDDVSNSSSAHSAGLNLGSPLHASSPVSGSVRARPAMPEKLRLMVINFQSIKNKKDLLGVMLEDNFDVIIGTETWLNPDIEDSEILPPTHKAFRRDRVDGYGGVILIFKQDLVVRELPMSDSVEFLIAQVECKSKCPVIVGVFYRPPNTGIDYMNGLCDSITQVVTQNQACPLWIGGDINLPDIDWETNSLIGYSTTRLINNTFIECLEHNNLDQIVSFPTRGNKTLDILTTNRPSLVNACSPMPGISDHDTAVLAEVDCSPKRDKPVRRKLYMWGRANLEQLKEYVQREVHAYVGNYSTSTPVQNLWDGFKSIIESSLSRFVPSKFSSTRFSQAWVTRHCRHIIRRKKRAYKKARKTNNQLDWNRFKALKKKSQRECRRAYQDFVANMICPDLKGNPKKFWGFIKGKRCDNNGVAPLTTNGVTHVDDRTKANVLNRQFASVFSSDLNPAPDLGDSGVPTMGDIWISVGGVAKLLSAVKPHKASGPDNIPARFLKECAREIAPALSLVFQASLNQSRIPDDWRAAWVAPVFKKGDRSRAGNYRPVSLTSICCKTLEHIIYSNIMSHFTSNNILTDYQHGFRSGRSCETQLILTIEDLARGLDSAKQIDAVLLDFSKAFDKVSHSKLLLKLDYYGVRGKVQAWIRDFLSDRTQAVVLRGNFSDLAPVTSGVPQGTVLGPLLFLAYINDLPMNLSATPRLFADDCLLYREIATPEDGQLLQRDLDQLQQWEIDWSMEFNPGKCEVLRITNKKKIIDTEYKIRGQVLPRVNSAKYLGVTIHNKLSWNPHVDRIAKKANSTRAFLQRNLHGAPTPVRAQCYKTFVRPILEYAATAWAPHTGINIQKLESVQRRAARFAVGDWRRTSSVSAMLSTLGWETLEERRARMRIAMLYNITCGNVAINGDSFVKAVPSHHSTRGASQKFVVPSCRTNIYKASFFPDAIRRWNKLPCAITEATSEDSLKVGLTGIKLT